MRELAERAVKAKGWRWMEGMAILIGVSCVERCVAVGARGPAYRDGYGRLTVVQFALPALDDPATVGCLLALVREACEPNRAPGDWPMLCTYQSQAKKWGVGAWLNESGKATFAALVLPSFDTEAEALVKALEAAP